MTSTLPISPLLALSRVDYLESSMLCIKLSTTLSAVQNGMQLDSNAVHAFRKFLPEFLGLDDLTDATPDSILPVALLAIAPALRESALVPVDEPNVTAYLDAIKLLDKQLESTLESESIERSQLKQLEVFARAFSDHMTTAVEQSIREGQALPL